MTEDELTQVHESPMSGLSKKYSSLDQLALPALDKTRQDEEGTINVVQDEMIMANLSWFQMD